MSARQFAQQHGIDTTRLLGSPNEETVTEQVKGLLGEGGTPKGATPDADSLSEIRRPRGLPLPRPRHPVARSNNIPLPNHQHCKLLQPQRRPAQTNNMELQRRRPLRLLPLLVDPLLRVPERRSANLP